MLTSHMLLALVAVQVFTQVWMHAVNAPFTGIIITIWISWKLGGLAAYADQMQSAIDQERLVAQQLVEMQTYFDSLPVDAQVYCGEQYREALGRLTHLHQLLVAQCQVPLVKPKFRDVLPSPSRWLVRRRERKIMATDKVVHA